MELLFGRWKSATPRSFSKRSFTPAPAQEVKLVHEVNFFLLPSLSENTLKSFYHSPCTFFLLHTSLHCFNLNASIFVFMYLIFYVYSFLFLYREGTVKIEVKFLVCVLKIAGNKSNSESDSLFMCTESCIHCVNFI